MADSENTDEERYLHEMLAMLRDNYAKAAEPYLKRLAEIHAMRRPQPIVIPIERQHVLWKMLMEQGVAPHSKSA